MVLATRGGAGCSRRSWRKKEEEVEEENLQRGKGGKEGEERDAVSVGAGERFLWWC